MYRACRCRAAPAPPQSGQVDVLPGRMMIERIARHDRNAHPPAAAPAVRFPAPARCRISRNGSSGSDNPSSAGAKPASRAGGNAPCACRGRPLRGSLRLPSFAACHFQPVEEARIRELAGARIGLVADLEIPSDRRLRESRPAAPADSYLRANSRSRWSCAGQPKIAPVP